MIKNRFKKRVLWVVILLFLLCVSIILSILTINYSGLVIQVPSVVGIDPGIRVLYNNFNGDTTGFIYLTDAELENIYLMTLERIAYGKVIPQTIINLTQDAVNNVVDLDSNINISDNYVYINTTSLHSLNGTIRVYLYGLNFTNPQVLRNGEHCPGTVCQIIGYSSGVLSFDIFGFSNSGFSVAEIPLSGPQTPSNDQPESPGLDSSSISYDVIGEIPKIITEADFSVSDDLIRVAVKQGEEERRTIQISNTGTEDLIFNISVQGINDFMIVGEEYFKIAEGKIKVLTLDFFAKEDEFPDIHTGKIIIRDQTGAERVINVIVEVRPKKAFFDVVASTDNKVVSQGSELKSDIRIINAGDLRNVDILLYYAIKGFDGRIYTFKEESIAIEEELNLVRFLEISKDIPEGVYVFLARVTYEGETAVSSYDFTVVKRKFFFFRLFDLTAIILVIIVLLIFLLIIYILKKKDLI